MEIAKLKAEHKKEMDACRQDFANRFDDCKKYYHNKIQNLKGAEKAQVAKEHSLMEKLNQVLQKSLTEKESKIEELKDEIAKIKNEREVVYNQNESLRNKNKMLYQARFHVRIEQQVLFSSVIFSITGVTES